MYRKIKMFYLLIYFKGNLENSMNNCLKQSGGKRMIFKISYLILCSVVFSILADQNLFFSGRVKDMDGATISYAEGILVRYTD
jgi:hypothetical protein